MRSGTLYFSVYTEYLGMMASDHRPVVAYLDDKVPKRKGQFVLIRDELDKRVLWNPLQWAGQIIV